MSENPCLVKDLASSGASHFLSNYVFVTSVLLTCIATGFVRSSCDELLCSIAVHRFTSSQWLKFWLSSSILLHNAPKLLMGFRS